MTRSILRAVFIGVLVGAAAFFVPHLLLGIFVLLVIVRLLHCGHGCYGHRRGHERLFYMADNIRKMSDEEYTEFKTKMGGKCCHNGYHAHGHYGRGCCSDSKMENSECCESKKDEATK